MKKPDHLIIICPYCSESNRLHVLILGEIYERAQTCAGCARLFSFSVHWKPEVSTHRGVDDPG